jgi:hypothetical protein
VPRLYVRTAYGFIYGDVRAPCGSVVPWQPGGATFQRHSTVTHASLSTPASMRELEVALCGSHDLEAFGRWMACGIGHLQAGAVALKTLIQMVAKRFPTRHREVVQGSVLRGRETSRRLRYVPSSIRREFRPGTPCEHSHGAECTHCAAWDGSATRSSVDIASFATACFLSVRK